MKPKSLILFPAIALLALGAPLPADPPAAPETPDEATASAEEGQVLFKQRCAACHKTEEGQSSPMGPTLAGIVGREAASGEFRYSSALKASGLSWTREHLDTYLTAPQKLVPGTRMVVGIPDAAQRAQVIDYLGSLSPEPVESATGDDIPPQAGEHEHPSDD